MQNDYFRYYKPKILLIIIGILSTIYGVILTYATGLINSSLFVSYVHFPSVTVLLTLTLCILNKYGLNQPLLKKLFWVQNISGRYEGKITYSHFKTGKEETKHCFLEVEQNASNITVNTYFDFKKAKKSEKTASESIITNINIKDEFDNQELVFTYHNKGNTVKSMPPSNGTNILSIIQRNETLYLEGVYYTDREPQTKGQMKVKFVSKTLKKEF